MVEWQTEDSFMGLLGDEIFILWFWNQDAEVALDPRTIIPNNPLTKVLLPTPTILSSAGSEGMLPPEQKIFSLNWKLWIMTGYVSLARECV